MPELPEVETIKTAVQKALGHAEIKDVTINERRLRMPVAEDFAAQLKGRKIVGYRRIAKYIVIDLDNRHSLIIHLGMSGRIRLSDTLPPTEKHDHIVFATTSGYMVYNDARRFGLCVIAESDNLSANPLFKHIGVDPFDNQLDGAYLFDKLRHKSVAVKQALLDQSLICGIGNIYASEALFGARILPTRAANSLSLEECEVLVAQVRQVLQQAIAAGGSTLRDYRKPDGSLGYFQNRHCVYNKTGERCPDCTCDLAVTGGIRKIVQNGRSTYFCATKQR